MKQWTPGDKAMLPVVIAEKPEDWDESITVVKLVKVKNHREGLTVHVNQLQAVNVFEEKMQGKSFKEFEKNMLESERSREDMAIQAAMAIWDWSTTDTMIKKMVDGLVVTEDDYGFVTVEEIVVGLLLIIKDLGERVSTTGCGCNDEDQRRKVVKILELVEAGLKVDS